MHIDADTDTDTVIETDMDTSKDCLLMNFVIISNNMPLYKIQYKSHLAFRCSKLWLTGLLLDISGGSRSVYITM